VIRAVGINCDQETEHALRLAGAETERIHVNRLARLSTPFDPYQLIVLPGGFSYGDDLISAKARTVELDAILGGALRVFVARGGLLLGIGSSFQTLIKAGLLPGVPALAGPERHFTLARNDSGRFETRWVRLAAPANARSVFVEPGEVIELPVAHGDGKFFASSADALRQLSADGLVGYHYATASGGGKPASAWPDNPNGSLDGIAALSDASGRVFGLMPHPERFLFRWHHPRWTREAAADKEGVGLSLFRRAVAACARA
jgi:phosphoribosylformylglycinamidine synthase